MRKFDNINSDTYIYKSNLKPEFAIDFYRNYMVKYQWKLLQYYSNLEFVKIGQILHFTKDKSEYCMVHISSDEGNTYIVIIVHQKNKRGKIPNLPDKGDIEGVFKGE